MHKNIKNFVAAFVFALALIWAQTADATQYINSAKQGTVTIASGSTTGTDSSPGAATGTYLLFYNGCNTTATTSAAQALARLSISGGTVTATRNTSSTNTVVCKYSLIDATSNLVTSVQYFNKAMTTTPATQTITAVTTADTSVFLDGYTTALASFHFDEDTPVVALTNSTTLTFTLINGASASSIGMQVMVVNWNHAALQSNTFYSTSWTNSTGSTAQTLSPSVVMGNTIIAYAGGGSPNGDVAADEQEIMLLTGTGTVTVSAGNTGSGNTMQANYWVTEFVSGVMLQNVQRNILAISAGTSNTVAPTSSAVTNTALIWTGFKTATSATTSYAAVMPNITQTSAALITATLGASGSSSQGWELAQFQDAGSPPPTYLPAPPQSLSF